MGVSRLFCLTLYNNKKNLKHRLGYKHIAWLDIYTFYKEIFKLEYKKKNKPLCHMSCNNSNLVVILTIFGNKVNTIWRTECYNLSLEGMLNQGY